MVDDDINKNRGLLNDRKCKIKPFCIFEISPEVSQHGVAHVFLLSDYRLIIMRDIQHILHNVDSNNE